MHCNTRENCPFSGLFLGFRGILTSGGYLLKSALKDSWGKRQGRKKYTPPPWRPSFFPSPGLRLYGVYTLLAGPMVYTLFPCFPRKMVYTIAFFAL